MGIRGTKTWDDIQNWLAAAGTVSAGSYTSAGIWTFGPSAGIGNSFHSINGSANFAGTGASISHIDEMDSGANWYSSFAGVGKAVSTNTGYSIFSTVRRTTATANAFIWSANYQDAQTAGATAVTTNNTTLGVITASGTWTFAQGAANATCHTFFGPTYAGTIVSGVLAIHTNGGGGSGYTGTWGIDGTGIKFGHDSTGRDIEFFTGNGTVLIINALGGLQASANTAGGAGPSIYYGVSTVASPGASDIILQCNFSGTGTSAGQYARFQRAGLTVGTIAQTGTTTSAFTGSSDARLKSDIVDMDNCLTTLMQIKPRKFKWLLDGHDDLGFIAQELQAVYPSAAFGNPEDDVTKTPMQVDYGRLTPILVGALKELKQQFDAYVLAHP